MISNQKDKAVFFVKKDKERLSSNLPIFDCLACGDIHSNVLGKERGILLRTLKVRVLGPSDLSLSMMLLLAYHN